MVIGAGHGHEALMERRAFFRSALQGVSKAIVAEVEKRAEIKAMRWIRPPFAKAELAFLLACTRCDRCIDACSPGVLFLLPSRLGPEVVSTPAMDLLNKGCPMCAGWPCVAACEPQALMLPTLQEGETPTVRLAQVTIDPRHCLPYAGPECGACASVCPQPGALHWTDTKPSINDSLCTGCALCREVCPTRPKAIGIKPLIPSQPVLS